MKTRVRFLILVCACLLLCLLTACGEENTRPRSSTVTENPDAPHTHTWVEESYLITPTCTKPGKVQKKCKCGYKINEDVAPWGHTEEILAKKEPSCTEEGLTEGKRCITCGIVTVEQQAIEMTEHSYVVKEGYESTCTEWGRADGKECTVCGKVILYHPTAPKGHYVRIIDGVKPTCTEAGISMGKECVTCGEVIMKQEIIPAKGHTEEIIPAVEATCTKRGSTEGVVCSECGKVLVPVETIYPKGHTETAVDKKLPSCTEPGHEAGAVCSVCGLVLLHCEEIPPTGHQFDDIRCTVCGIRKED